MNNKIVFIALIVGIATTGFAGISAANQGVFGESIEQGVEQMESRIHQGFKTSEFKIYGKGSGLDKLTPDEIEMLKSMSNEQRQAFFKQKRAEKVAKKDAVKAVIDKLIAGESLTASEEATRLEVLGEMEERSGKHTKPGAEIIAKILAGDALTEDETAQFARMQERHAERAVERAKVEAMSEEEREAYFEAKKSEREAQKIEIKELREKVKNGEELTDTEQVTLDEAKMHFKKKSNRG